MALAIFLATGVTMQAQDRLTQYKVRNAISVRTPIMNDSINPKGEKQHRSKGEKQKRERSLNSEKERQEDQKRQ